MVETGSREEIEQRALPFQVGEEVLVSIEEPHMYNVDDAVARVDSYIVSVAGAGPHVGEQRMVRIESVGRSAATAALLDSDGNVVQAGANGDGGEKLESAAFRRAPTSRKQGRKATLTRRRGQQELEEIVMASYAVIETGGKQYRVEKGSTLLVDRLSAKEGDKVDLRAVAFRDKEMVLGDDLEKVKVEAKVAGHERGPKIRVFKYRPKKGYRQPRRAPLRAHPPGDH